MAGSGGMDRARRGGGDRTKIASREIGETMANTGSRKIRRALLMMLLVAAVRLAAQTGVALDIVIVNGHIIDGTGSPWYSGDVGIREGKIAAIGNLNGAPRKRTIDAAGKVVEI